MKCAEQLLNDSLLWISPNSSFPIWYFILVTTTTKALNLIGSLTLLRTSVREKKRHVECCIRNPVDAGAEVYVEVPDDRYFPRGLSMTPFVTKLEDTGLYRVRIPVTNSSQRTMKRMYATNKNNMSFRRMLVTIKKYDDSPIPYPTVIHYYWVEGDRDFNLRPHRNSKDKEKSQPYIMMSKPSLLKSFKTGVKDAPPAKVYRQSFSDAGGLDCKDLSSMPWNLE